MRMLSPMTSLQEWPELRVAEWRETYATLLLYTQIVGKIRLALTPKLNQWWNVTLHVTARGLTTGPMPFGGGLLSIDFDFVEHRLLIQDSDGHVRVLPLDAKPVCFFYSDLMTALGELGPSLVRIWQQPQECPVTTPFSEDREHAHYDRAAVGRYWQALRRIEPVFQSFRAGFRGKCSPVHFFWGGVRPGGDPLQRQARAAAAGKGRSRRLRRGGDLARVLAGRSLGRHGRDRGDVLFVHGPRARRAVRCAGLAGSQPRGTRR